MIAVLSKPRNEIDISDIQSLIDSKIPEGEQIEFKEAVPAKGDSSPDPWMSDQSRIGDRAKNEIMEEAVAFANAHGGVLLLGIEESESKPPVAAGISPIPQCAELASRLSQIFDDCVDPRLPKIEIFAVPTEDENGVVVIRVDLSRLSPHRVKTTRKWPIRRADRCDEMSMLEIQHKMQNAMPNGPEHLDKNQRSDGQKRLEKQLSERSERFREEEFKKLETPENAFGVRMTAAPLRNEVQFTHVFMGTKLSMITSNRGIRFFANKIRMTMDCGMLIYMVNTGSQC